MEENTKVASNFLTQIIDEDLKQGKYSKIFTRFPPEPNGYLHIGHIKSICLNFGLAKDYQGLCNLRFDDTNPSKEEIEYIEAIKEDVKWLGFEWNEEPRFASDYFDKFYACAIELIEKGLAYVDELSPDEIREYRGTLTEAGKNSPYRERSVAENLELFEQMKQGQFEAGKACLRAKIDMASPFIVMRDPVLYRIKFEHHHQTGDKWCIYPMYDFAHCISDAIEGISHSICTLEFQDNRRLYDWILDNLAIGKAPRPYQHEFARLNLEGTLTSKRKLLSLVNDKVVSGWDDPRMTTVSGMRRRGYPASSLREFCKRIGVSRQDNLIEFSALEACVRDELNQNAPRAMAVLDPVRVVLENFEGEQILNIANHPNREELGTREVIFSKEIYIDRADFREEANKNYKRLVLGKEVRLRGAYVIKAERVEYENDAISTIYCTVDLDTLGKNPADGRKVKGVIHWVCATNNLPCKFHIYENLFTEKNPGAFDLEEVLNPNSLTVKTGFAEKSLAQAKIGEGYQFEREGYFCLDKEKSDLPIFNLIVSLKESFVA